MLKTLAQWYRGQPDQPYVRPWGLAAPILVLLVCIPLLRPLRHPELTLMSDNELARLATVQALVEHQTLAIDHTSFRPTPAMTTRSHTGSHATYSKQAPVLSVLLAGPYWALHRLGITFDKNFAIATFLLTLVGATLPVAMAAGLIYRLGRLFELYRPWRTLLAFAAVFGSGLVSYATVLNTHAPAAALILATCGCLFHAGMARKRSQSHSWLLLAGLVAGLAAVIDFSAFVFLFMLAFVILAMRWPVSSRVGGVAWYMLGSLPALALHTVLMLPITGDLRPGFLHPELLNAPPAATQLLPFRADDDEEDDGPSWLGQAINRTVDGLVGAHGLLPHFPVLVIGLTGIWTVLHRNWPVATKTMAAATIAGGAIIVAAQVILAPRWEQPMFAARWFIPFLPLTVFWSGVWLRNRWHPAVWATAITLLAFSVIVTIIGATNPFVQPREGEFTAYAVVRQWVSGE